MPNTYTTLSGLFAAIANAIRAKKGTTGTIVADNFPSEIESIASQPLLQSKTVSPSTAAQTITPDSGYDGLSQVVVNAISPTKGAQTYTPTTIDQTIDSGRWLTGAQTIKGDSNLVASNIKSGVSIFGVSGGYSGGEIYSTNIELSNSSTFTVQCGFTPRAIAVYSYSKSIKYSTSSVTDYIVLSLFVIRGGHAGEVTYKVYSDDLRVYSYDYDVTQAENNYTINWNDSSITVTSNVKNNFFDGKYTVVCIS